MNSDRTHWEYYFTLEDDLAIAGRYVEICEENFTTHSIHFVRLLLAAGSEIDVIAKSLCRQINPAGKANNIDQYRDTIVPAFPAIPQVWMEVRSTRIQVQPWNEWANSQPANPSWWRTYNNVKHERNNYFRAANLHNAISAIAALYCLIRHLKEDAGLPKPNRLITIGRSPKKNFDQE